MGTASLERNAVRKFLRSPGIVVFAWLSACGFEARADDAVATGSPPTTLVVVVGAAGEESYGKIFAEELALWRTTASDAAATLRVVGDPAVDELAKSDNDPSDKDRLQKLLADELESTNDVAPLWLVFVGHGTFDGRTAAFNLRGPDVSSGELAEWLKECRRPLAVVNTTAASAPFLTALSAPGRVVITATRSGQQRNYARFGRYFAKRVVDPAADLDKDDQTSLLEAYLAAARDTAEFYKSEGRIATEHPLLDDDGDGRGVRMDFFTGVRLTKAPTSGTTADGELARRFCLKPSDAERDLSLAQIAERDKLEAALADARRRKSELAEDAYLAEIEPLLTALARLYQSRADD